MSIINLFRPIPDRKWEPDEKPVELWGRLSQAWRDLITQTVEQRRAIYIVTQEFTGPIASLAFDAGVTTRPIGVSLVSLVQPQTNVTSAVTFAWTYANGKIATTAFSAVAAGTWRASFLIFRGGV